MSSDFFFIVFRQNFLFKIFEMYLNIKFEMNETNILFYIV